VPRSSPSQAGSEDLCREFMIQSSGGAVLACAPSGNSRVQTKELCPRPLASRSPRSFPGGASTAPPNGQTPFRGCDYFCARSFSRSLPPVLLSAIGYWLFAKRRRRFARHALPNGQRAFANRQELIEQFVVTSAVLLVRLESVPDSNVFLGCAGVIRLLPDGN
jgi:hypothetical protein